MSQAAARACSRTESDTRTGERAPTVALWNPRGPCVNPIKVIQPSQLIVRTVDLSTCCLGLEEKHPAEKGGVRAEGGKLDSYTKV